MLQASNTRVALTAQGYTPGAPDHAKTLDTTIAQALHCPDCRRPMRHVGFTKNGSYRAFAMCDFCDNAQEIHEGE